MTTALVIGGGPAGLMAADVLSAAGCNVTLTDQMPTVGRKFLMAGKSGLNLTKSESFETFVNAYIHLPAQLRWALDDFGPEQVVEWANDLGQDVFKGSTGRIFPKMMKASPLLRAWIARLTSQGATIQTRHRWVGWDGDTARFDTPDGTTSIRSDITILALGGASWQRLGSDGAWTKHIADTRPFQPSNCGFQVAWSRHMDGVLGHPIKSTCLTAGSRTSRGEWVLTHKGIEGGGIYEVSAAMRDGHPLIVDLVPDLSRQDIHDRLAKGRPGRTKTQFLKSGLRLPPAKVALFLEMTKGEIVDLANDLKALKVSHNGPLPIDEAISTAGGVSNDALNERLMLIQRPGVFCAGEMLDWDAPTGGYLLTACFATGRKAAKDALHWHKELAEMP